MLVSVRVVEFLSFTHLVNRPLSFVVCIAGAAVPAAKPETKIPTVLRYSTLFEKQVELFKNTLINIKNIHSVHTVNGLIKIKKSKR